MKSFKESIGQISPDHDYPAGLIHPYWARKPLNIIESIVCHYSKEGDTVADPFMGSGTSIIAAIKNNRNAVGSDLSPISKLLVESILNSAKSPSKYRKILIDAVENWTNFAIDLYKTNDDRCVERETFFVEGEYINSQFSLTLENAKIKSIKNKEIKGKPEIVNIVEYQNALDSYFVNNPIDFSKIDFIENTRIAVHNGVKASDFFTERNIVFINHAQMYIEKNLTCNKEIDFLKLFLSSMIPMLRLSDKKASSQWPYWRPKKHLTSRNPLVAIKRRYNSFLECLDWEDGNLNSTNIKSKIYHCSADSISKFYNTKVDLIITDPPYADHAPYMEYSDLYWSIISGQRTHHLWSKEIVKTNAVGRENDSLDYENRMYKSIKSILSILKDDGYFVFFYLDKNINHWEAIKSALRSSNCVTEDVITIPRQRKSMKTVTSPGKTLDGDLIVVCRKTFDIQHNYKPLLMNELLGQTEGATYFDRFSSFIKNYLTNEVSDSSDWNLKDISRLL